MVNFSQLGQVANPFLDSPEDPRLRAQKRAQALASNQALTQAIFPTGTTPVPGATARPRVPPPTTPTPTLPPSAPVPGVPPIASRVPPGTTRPTPGIPPRQDGVRLPGTPPPAGPPVVTRRTATPSPPPPTAPPPPNQFGTRVNLDPVWIEQQVRAAFAKKGVVPTAEEVAYWVRKALTPDIYSDEKVRVGWNAYWEDRLLTGSDSSDPRLAGDDGVIADPAAYGYGTYRGSDGNVYFTNPAHSQRGGGGTPPVTPPTTPPRNVAVPRVPVSRIPTTPPPGPSTTAQSQGVQGVLADILARLAAGVPLGG